MRKFLAEALVVSIVIGNGIAFLPKFGAAQLAPLPDMVLRWNEVLNDAQVVDHTPGAGVPGAGAKKHAGPTRAARAMAMVHIAIYDAVNAIVQTHTPVAFDETAPRTANVQAAIIVAAHDVLVELYPEQSASFDAYMADDLAQIPDGQDKTDGMAVGAAAADACILSRTGDGSENIVDFQQSDQPGHWRPDPLHPNQMAYAAEYGLVKTFGMGVADDYVAIPPPALNSPEYTAAYNEVKEYGAKNSTVRTQDQTNISYYWGYDGAPGLGVPPRLYNQITQHIAIQEGNTEIENARLFALVNMAQADAGIAAWKTKYTYDYWRPITAIRESDEGTGPTGLGDGNPDTVGDPEWEPLGAPASNPQLSATPGDPPTNFTPPFPAYTSGHATFGAATFRTLRNFYGTDNIAFTFVSDELNGETIDADGSVRPLAPRSFTSFSQAAEENGQSRIYMGVHWSFDKEQGIVTGNALADAVFANNLLPLPNTDLQAIVTGPELVLGNADFSASVTLKNFGPLVSNGAVATIAVPGDFVYDTVQSDPRCALGQNAVVTCAVGLEAGLPVGESETFDLYFTAGTELCSTTATFVVSVDGDEADLEFANNIAQLPVFVGCPTEGQVELEASLTGSDRVFRGDEISYELSVTNDGPGLASSVTATLPLGGLTLAVAGNPPECTQVGGDVVCTVSELSAGSSRSFSLKVATQLESQCPQDVTAVASVTSESSDYYPGNNESDPVVTRIECEPVADVSVELTVPSSVQRETELRSSLRVRNNGPATATNVIASIELPAGVTFLPLGGSAECTLGSGTVDCRAASVDVGSSKTFDVVFTTLAGYACNGTVEQQATVTASERDNTPDNNLTNRAVTNITCNSVQERSSGGGTQDNDDDGNEKERQEKSLSHSHRGHGTTEAAVVMSFLAKSNNIVITDNNGQDQAQFVGHFAFAADASRIFALKMDPFGLKTVAYAPFTDDELSVICGMKSYLHQDAHVNRMNKMMPWVIQKLSAMLSRDPADIEAALEGEATCK